MVILGAGLTGLSAAFHGGGTIYEKEAHIGGKCASPTVKGYTFDLGIHVLHTANNYVLKLLLEKLNGTLGIYERDARIYSYDTLTRYPFQANTYGLPLKVVKDCLLGFMKAYNDNNINFENYEKWIYSSFGKGIAEHFFLPYSEKFWTVLAKDMTTDWIDIRVPVPEMEEVFKGALSDQKKGFGPNWKFRYPKGKKGISKLAHLFHSQGIDVNLNKEAVEIDVKAKKITFSDSSAVRYDKLISTIPLPELVRIIPDIPDRIMKAGGKLRYNSIFCVNLGIKREALNEAHWIYYPHKDYSFFRISFPKNFCKGLVPKGKSSVSAEIAYSPKKNISKNAIIKKTIKDLVKGKIISSSDKIDLIDTRDIKYGYVIYDHKREKNVTIVKDFLKKNNIYTAGRYGSWEYFWMDDSILDGKRAAIEAKNGKKRK